MNLFEDTYLTISKPSEGIFKDRGSKFIAYAYPVTTEAEIKEHLNYLRKEHFSARHHCYAFRLGPDKSAYRANDDGEPTNSAGKPILGQIQSKDLTNILIVVVRYFGGTLLGVSGLINAYRSAAAEALASAEIIEKLVQDVYELSFDYLQMNDVMKIIKDEELKIISQNFDTSCIIKFSVRKNSAERAEGLFRKLTGTSINYITTF
jgi:uncharacterized YigZ family protein